MHMVPSGFFLLVEFSLHTQGKAYIIYFPLVYIYCPAKGHCWNKTLSSPPYSRLGTEEASVQKQTLALCFPSLRVSFHYLFLVVLILLSPIFFLSGTFFILFKGYPTHSLYC